jgi:hypothetical protein
MVHRLGKIVLLLVVTALILSYASFAFCAPYVSISSSGNGVFDLQGIDFVGVSGAMVTITYDTATLSNPEVAQGGLMAGSLMAANTSPPGNIVIALLNSSATAISGSGSLATIRFDLPGSSLGVIQSVRLELINSAGNRLPAQQAVISNPIGSKTQDTSGDETKTTSQNSTPQYPETTTTPAAGTGGGSSNVVGGTVNIPGEGEPSKPDAKGSPAADGAEQQKKEASGTPETGEAADKASSGTSSTGEAGKKQDTKPVFYQSVLERFRTFTGPRTVQSLVALFDSSDMKGVRQEPPVALSDGVAVVTIYISQPPGEKEAPNFAFRNAKYRSLKMAGENSWAVEVLPETGGTSAAVKMLHQGVLTEVPLTIAPPLPADVKIGTGGALSEADFNVFLKERGTTKSPRFDLNGDGKRDYLDEYIFTANYLVKRDSRKKATVKEQK